MDILKKKGYLLLRKSEKYFKTDMVYLTKGGFWLSMGQIIAALSSFLLAIAFAHFLPKESYGTYKYTLAIAGILSVFTLPGMSTAVTQAVSRGLSNVLRPAFTARLKWGAAGAVISFIAAFYYYNQHNLILASSLVIIGIFSPLMEAYGLYDSVLLGKQKFYTSTKYFIIAHVSFVVCSLLAFNFTKNVVVFVFIYFFSWTLFRFVFYKKSLNGHTTETTETRSVITYGNHLSFMGIIGILANYADRILLFHYVGAQEAAIYSIAIALPEQMKGMFKNLSTLALPKFSKSATIPEDGSLWKKMMHLMLILVAATILYIFVAPLLFQLFFPKYVESIVYSQIFAISIVAICSIIPVSYLQATESTKELYVFNICSPSVQLILLFVGAYWYGLLGVIIARVVGRFFNLFLSFVLLRVKISKS